MLALGDSSYELFCNAGKLLDERLEALGATRLTDRVDVDGFYEQPAAAWTADAGQAADRRSRPRPAPSAVPIPEPPSRGAPRSRSTPGWPSTGAQRRPSPTRRSATTRSTSPAPESPIRQAIPSPCTPPTIPLWSTRSWPSSASAPDHAVTDHDEPLGVLLTEHLEIRTPSRALQALVAAAPDRRRRALRTARTSSTCIGAGRPRRSTRSSTRCGRCSSATTRSRRAHWCTPTACT